MAVVLGGAGFDWAATQGMMAAGFPAVVSKAVAAAAGVIYNCLARRYLVFPEKRPAPRTREGAGQAVGPASLSERADEIPVAAESGSRG